MKHLAKCLPSVLEQNYPEFEVILVDNASTDGSVSYVKNNFENVKIIKNMKNIGFAGGNNVGIRASKGELIVLLNQDTVVDPSWLSQLVRVMTRREDVGICMPKILLFDERDNLNTDGVKINFLGFGWPGGYRKKDKGDNKVKEIDFASGASMMLRRDVLQKVGLFDKDFFLYHEDSDLGWRIRLSGYNIVCVPTSVVYHKYVFTFNKRKFYYLERNRIILLIKNFKARTFMLIFPAFLLTEVGVLLYSLKNGLFAQKIRSYLYIIQNANRYL